MSPLIIYDHLITDLFLINLTKLIIHLKGRFFFIFTITNEMYNDFTFQRAYLDIIKVYIDILSLNYECVSSVYSLFKIKIKIND